MGGGGGLSGRFLRAGAVSPSIARRQAAIDDN